MKNIKITREQFDADLFNFANAWTDEVMQRIAEQADEIWENEAVVFMLNKRAEKKRAAEEQRRREFKERCEGEEEVIVLSKYSREEANAYHQVLTDLLCGFGKQQ